MIIDDDADCGVTGMSVRPAVCQSVVGWSIGKS